MIITAGSRQFVVCVHDVHPGTYPEILPVLDALEPLVGAVVSAAVVPKPGGVAWPMGAAADALRRMLHQSASEVLLHGLTHRRAWSLDPLSWLIGRCDELAGLSRVRVLDRAREGLETMQTAIGREVRGAVPPGWRSGYLGELLGELGLSFLVGIHALVTASGKRQALATWSWDAGPIAPAGWLLECAGALLAREAATPVVVLHPADVRRRFLPRAIRRIRLLLDEGGVPVTFAHLAASMTEP
jgi:peptidoglycan/xylan/chitin deacetylase (PgdA/CDA1 family)